MSVLFLSFDVDTVQGCFHVLGGFAPDKDIVMYGYDTWEVFEGYLYPIMEQFRRWGGSKE